MTTHSPQAVSDSDPDELRREIEDTRAELGATVEALAGKLDVKSRARHKATQLKSQATSQASQLPATVRTAAVEHRTVLLAATATALAVIALAAWRRGW